MAKTIKMVRKEPEYIGGPVTADVCEDAVGAFLGTGWIKAETKDEPKAKVDPKVEVKAEPKVEPKVEIKNPKKGK